jgi:hypothetical protein
MESTGNESMRLRSRQCGGRDSRRNPSISSEGLNKRYQCWKESAAIIKLASCRLCCQREDHHLPAGYPTEFRGKVRAVRLKQVASMLLGSRPMVDSFLFLFYVSLNWKDLLISQYRVRRHILLYLSRPGPSGEPLLVFAMRPAPFPLTSAPLRKLMSRV